MLSYKPLRSILAKRNIGKKELMYKADISLTTVDKLLKDESVTLPVLERVCNFLDCKIGDIVEFVSEEELVKN